MDNSLPKLTVFISLFLIKLSTKPISIIMRLSQLFLNSLWVDWMKTECLGSTTGGFLLLRKPHAAPFLAQVALSLPLLSLLSEVWAEQQSLISACQLVSDQLISGLPPGPSLLQGHLLSRRVWSTGVPLGGDAGKTESGSSSLFSVCTLLLHSATANLPSGHTVQWLVGELGQFVHDHLHLHICGRKEVGVDMDLVLTSVENHHFIY